MLKILFILFYSFNLHAQLSDFGDLSSEFNKPIKPKVIKVKKAQKPIEEVKTEEKVKVSEKLQVIEKKEPVKVEFKVQPYIASPVGNKAVDQNTKELKKKIERKQELTQKVQEALKRKQKKYEELKKLGIVDYIHN